MRPAVLPAVLKWFGTCNPLVLSAERSAAYRRTVGQPPHFGFRGSPNRRRPGDTTFVPLVYSALAGFSLVAKCVAVVFLVLLPMAAPAAVSSGNPKELWVIDPHNMNHAEEILAATLQGHLAHDKQARIWIKAGGMSEVLLAEMQRDGVKTHDAASVWDLVKQFRSKIKGAIVYKAGDESVSVATSLCGPLDGVAVDETLLDKAKTEGLVVIEDLRGVTEKEALAKYGSLFKHGIIVCQGLDKGCQLRDFAVANNAFVFHHDDEAFCTEVTKTLGPTALVFGWGKDEHKWIRDVSSGNGTGVPADWCTNLSVMQGLPAKIKRPADKPIKAEDRTRYIAFVMSDGDNIQVLTGGFGTDKNYWASPLRGRFPMTWEMSPILAEAAPRVLHYYYSTAKPSDGFVTGPGAPGYTFPHFQPDRVAIAKQAASFLRESGLSIVSVLNDNGGKLEDTIPLLDQPEVDAVIYKDYAPYNRRKGEILWHNGKPCISYKFLLWEGLQEPQDVAREVAKTPTSPKTDQGSYALVNVHAWSFGKSGGPVEAVKRAIELLPPNTKVVTANQLIAMLKENLAKQHP